MSRPLSTTAAWQQRVMQDDLWLRSADVTSHLGAGVQSQERWEEWQDFVAPLMGPARDDADSLSVER